MWSVRRAWFVFAAVFAAVVLPACGRSFVSDDLTSGDTTTSIPTTSTSTGSTTSTGTPGFCGDGVVDPGEQCDDGDHTSGDGCSLCLVELGWACAGEPSSCEAICGDGLLVSSQEDCDDGNATNGDGCDMFCMVEPPLPGCGDGKVSSVEQCDDGNTVSGDGCSSCFVDKGFTCAGQPSSCFTTCGDGVRAGAEVCDDGNQSNGDGCGVSCTVEVGWKCDASSPTFCNPVCGDDIVVGFEQCDDGNTVSGDGCSATCQLELGALCGDGVQSGAEKCDDGNQANGDCCSSTCQIEPGCEIEVNDTISTANDFQALAIGGNVKGFIRPGADRDVFSVVVPANAKGSITAVTLDGFVGSTCQSNQLDTFLTIYDAMGGTIATDDDSGVGFCAQVTANALGPGTYYVEVKRAAFGGPMLTLDYTLRVTTSLAICGNGAKEAGEACDDGNTTNGDGCSSQCLLETILQEVEPNDSFAQADANAMAGLSFTGDGLIGGSISNVNDRDTFKLVLPTPTVMRFETFDLSLEDCTNATKTRLTIFNASLLQVVTDTNSGIATCSAIVYPLPAGTYYVQVTGVLPMATVAAYYLELKAQADVGGEIESNDTIATATSLSGTNIVARGDHQMNAEADFYAITVPQGASIRAEIIEGVGSPEACESSGMDSMLTLFDAATTQLANDDDNGRGLCSLIDGTGSAPAQPGAHALEAGTYYLRVAASMFAMAGQQGQFSYRLQVTVR